MLLDAARALAAEVIPYDKSSLKFRLVLKQFEPHDHAWQERPGSNFA